MKKLLFAIIALIFASFTASNKLNGNWIIKGAIGKTLTFTKAANPSAFKANKVGLEIKDQSLTIHLMIPGKGKAEMSHSSFSKTVGDVWTELDYVKQHPEAQKISGSYTLVSATENQLNFEAK